jgi:hypothetical protein
MLTKLQRLSVDVEGRYATASELQFLKDYLDTADSRIALYEKLGATHEEIDTTIETTLKAIDPSIYYRGDRDVSAICKRDRQHALRCLAIAMLTDDLERLRDDYLLWDQKIVRAFRDQRPVKLTYQILAQTLENALTTEESALILESVQLAGVTLSA